MPVLWGMCDSLSTPRPLGPLRDVARELGPEVTAVLREAGVQHEIFAAVLDALQSRACALVVEDLHWGDEATLDLVRFLARRIGTLPLLLVLSYRETGGAAHPLRAVLGDLVGAPDASRLQLTPLSRAAVAELLDGHRLDPVDVHARTAGNPFFVSQILAQPDSPMPESVRDAVVARTAALTPERAPGAGAAVVRARGGQRDAARRPGRAARDRRGARRHRAARPPRPWRRVPARDRALGGARRGAARRGTRPAHQDDRGARGGRRGRQRARPPCDGRRGRPADPALRRGRGRRRRAVRRAPRGRRVLRARAAAPR